MPRAKGRDSIPQEITAAVEQIAGGDARQVKWFFSYIETDDATRAARDAGYSKHLSWRGTWLTRKFARLILEASMIRRAAIEPLAIRVLEEVLRTPASVPLVLRSREGGEVAALDGEGKPIMVTDAKLLGVKVKAADSVLDRGLMPKGLALHGLSPNPQEGQVSRDVPTLLDALVEDFGGGSQGAAVVLKLPRIAGYKEYRDYLLERYPQPKMLNEPAPVQQGMPS